jgi:hypothetical protein
MGKGNIIQLMDGRPDDWDTKGHWENRSLDDIDGELWKEIDIFGQNLLVSNMGRIKSPAKPHKPWPNILRQKRHNDYLRIKVSVGGGKYKTPNVHNYVGMCWIPNPNNLPEVNHKWGNKLDNRASSLEWITGRGNRVHAINFGLNPVVGKSGQDHHHSKLTNEETIEIVRSELSSRELSKKFGVTQNHINAIKAGVSRSSITGIKRKGKCQDK